MSSGRIHFELDARGRTSLFGLAEAGNLAEVERIIFSLPGTGISCQRLALISHKDNCGKTAIDVAAEAGQAEVRDLLQRERMRMEMFE